mgnify:CR=1 FL=1
MVIAAISALVLEGVKTIKDYFDVYVGMVTGKEDVFKNTIYGNIKILNDKEYRSDLFNEIQYKFEKSEKLIALGFLNEPLMGINNEKTREWALQCLESSFAS